MTSEATDKIQRMIQPEELKQNKPMLWATRRGHSKVVKLLKRQGAH